MTQRICSVWSASCGLIRRRSPCVCYHHHPTNPTFHPHSTPHTHPRFNSNVLSTTTSRSLVLVDELGKGTEVRAGTALAACMLEGLVARRCAGVFATHLHLLHCLPLRDDGLVRWRMEVVDGEWRGEGGYPLEGARGICVFSMQLVLRWVCTGSNSLICCCFLYRALTLGTCFWGPPSRELRRI